MNEFETLDVTFVINDKPGVYVLYYNDVCLYVGHSKHVIQRIRKHRANGLMQFNRAEVRFCELEDLARLEFVFIRKLQPRCNVQNVGEPLVDRKIDLVALGLPKRG